MLLAGKKNNTTAVRLSVDDPPLHYLKSIIHDRLTSQNVLATGKTL